MLLQSLFAILLLGAVSTATENVHKANAYIDEFIARATNGSGGFIDPLPLEDIIERVERKLAFVTMEGEAKLYDGKIEGLSTLQRVGDTSVIDLDNMLLISCSMRFKKLKAFYRLSVTFSDVGPEITFNAAVGSSTVSMSLTVPTKGGNATLTSFNIESLRNLRLNVQGIGKYSVPFSLISSLALNVLNNPVAKYASGKVYHVFSEEIGKVPYPGN